MIVHPRRKGGEMGRTITKLLKDSRLGRFTPIPSRNHWPLEVETEDGMAYLLGTGVHGQSNILNPYVDLSQWRTLILVYAKGPKEPGPYWQGRLAIYGVPRQSCSNSLPTKTTLDSPWNHSPRMKTASFPI